MEVNGVKIELADEKRKQKLRKEIRLNVKRDGLAECKNLLNRRQGKRVTIGEKRVKKRLAGEK